MTATIYPIIHNTIADSVYHDLITQSAKYYYFLGKTLPYNNGQEVVPLPTNDYRYELDTRKEIIEMKKITANDVSFVVPKYDWISGTVYDHYDDIEDISDKQFYVLTKDYNVYKCLDNNYGSASLIEPSSIDTDPFVLSDGYKWKFMMTLPLSLRTKFLTPGYMPVTVALRSKFYNNGGIDSVVIENGGSGYVDGSTNLNVQSSTGLGAVLLPVINNGVIVDVVIYNAGEGYTYADVSAMGNGVDDTDAIISVITSEGAIDTTQANVELLAVDGAIDFIKVTEQGYGYGNATVVIDGDGQDASAIPVIVDTRIVGIEMLTRGRGYNYVTVTINGNGTGAKARAILPPVGGHGKNAVNELLADTLMFFSNISTERNHGFIMNNDFRQFGIIRNPTKFGTSIDFNDSFGSACYVSTVTVDKTKFKEDDEIYNLNGKRFKIIAIKDTALLLQSFDNAIPIAGHSYTNSRNLEPVTLGAITAPHINKYSGKMLYVDNRQAFYQTEDQSITFQTAIKF